MNLELFSEKFNDLQNLDFGAKTEFNPGEFPVIPNTIFADNISFRNVQRFVSNGLKDYVLCDLSKPDSQAFGLWILGSYFQQKHEVYKLFITREDSEIEQVWIDFRWHKIPHPGNPAYTFVYESPIDVSLEKFTWVADKVENLQVNEAFHFNQKISLLLSSESGETLNLKQFNSRNVLIGFGRLGGGLLAAEFFLNLGLQVSDVNYEYISHDFYEKLADEESCNFRAEVYHQSPNSTEEDEKAC